jgi:nucleoside-diphosphate-sugar epimerase
LSRDNEVWGLARFSDPATRVGYPASAATPAPTSTGSGAEWGLARMHEPMTRERIESLGIRTYVADTSADGALDDLPDDFTHVLHLAYFRGGDGDFDEAMRINGEGTGLLLEHCRRAEAALVMSSNAVYPAHDDPWHAHREDGPIGGMPPFWSPTSASSKVAEEAVARYCARSLDLPVTIARLNTVYGPYPDLTPVAHMDAVVAGRPVSARWDPCPHAPIHVDDIVGQVEAMLDAATVPATIVNWAGDEQVTVQEWCAQAAELAGTTAEVVVNPVPGNTRSNLADATRRRAITGPCQVPFADGFRRIFQQRHGAVA